MREGDGKLKRLNIALAIVLILVMFVPFAEASMGNRKGGVEEFNNFKHFDRKENLIHLFAESLFPSLPEGLATVKEDQLVTWGCEWYDFTEEALNNKVESLWTSTVFMIDGVAVNGWFYTEVYFFETWDHDGDGPGDGDGDGIGDAGPDYYHSAFRYSTTLDVGEHTWYHEAVNPDTSELFVDSGTVIVLPED